AGPMKWPHLSLRQDFAEPNRRTNRLFLANMSMSSPAFTSDKHATIGDTLAPVSALSDRLPDRGDGRKALPSRRAGPHRRGIRLCLAAAAGPAGEAARFGLHLGRYS